MKSPENTHKNFNTKLPKYGQICLILDEGFDDIHMWLHDIYDCSQHRSLDLEFKKKNKFSLMIFKGLTLLLKVQSTKVTLNLTSFGVVWFHYVHPKELPLSLSLSLSPNDLLLYFSTS